MNRRRRTEILIKGSTEIAKKMFIEIGEKYEVKIIEEPNNGLVMTKMREEAQKSLFYLGEVLVTEAKVQINGKLGIGIVRGNETELSYWLAVIDAAYNADLEETKSWQKLLEDEEKRIDEEMQKYNSRVLKTKVNFATMDN
ncbi:phosphonate C-P lyase system protein PhnG [Clostridium sp. BL-8]|uniref:phosphonate C-P lyase system protein PhnG n=1 Tax=Clostridium sp. BL-8 TaxID=349938 RepID=UPI00098CC9BD|nr:phosphonate C-P lyase system protein PhnG [Clostridium sp. BL-8]OOM78636.1 phosphonate metabolism protein PhnG [Clostridium sp. BL-8]